MECRFWEKVDKNGPIPAHCSELGPCWIWTAARNDEEGYGVLKVPGVKELVRAHVYSWALHNGEKPCGLWVLHHCDNPPCVNPAHLFVGTHQDNIDDMVSKGRHLVERVQLTSEAREQMRAEYQKGGVTHPDLAEKYGISLNTVGRILRGE